MSQSKTIKNPSPLVLSVLSIDEYFGDLRRLADRIEALEMKSNFDHEQSQRLITLFAEAGQGLSTEIAKFVGVLGEAREQAEADAERVSAKADLLKARKDNVQDQMGRFQALSEKVRVLNESLLDFRRPAGEGFSPEDQANLKSRLADVAGQLAGLIEEAQELQQVGRAANIKMLEQNADSMRQSLIAVNHKIQGMM